MGWKCSSKFKVIHVCLFDVEVRASPPLFMQTVRRRAGAGEHLACLPFPCILFLGGKAAPLNLFH